MPIPASHGPLDPDPRHGPRLSAVVQSLLGEGRPAQATELQRLQQVRLELEQHAAAMARELACLEAETRALLRADGAVGTGGEPHVLTGQRVLYVGGRPSANPAIRALVLRSGGEYRRHDTLDDEAARRSLAWASVVVLAGDCFDHDAVEAMEVAAAVRGVRCLLARTATLASFAAAVGTLRTAPGGAPGPGCWRHR